MSGLGDRKACHIEVALPPVGVGVHQKTQNVARGRDGSSECRGRYISGYSGGDGGGTHNRGASGTGETRRALRGNLLHSSHRPV